MFKVMELLSLYDSYDRVVGNRWVQAHPMVYKTYGMAERILSNLIDAYGGDSAVLDNAQCPRHDGSTGRVNNFFPSVFNLKWVEVCDE